MSHEAPNSMVLMTITPEEAKEILKTLPPESQNGANAKIIERHREVIKANRPLKTKIVYHSSGKLVRGMNVLMAIAMGKTPAQVMVQQPIPVGDRSRDRTEAIKQGLKRYRDGRACKHGHQNPERLTSNGRCIVCHNLAHNRAHQERRLGKQLRVNRFGFDPWDLRHLPNGSELKYNRGGRDPGEDEIRAVLEVVKGKTYVGVDYRGIRKPRNGIRRHNDNHLREADQNGGGYRHDPGEVGEPSAGPRQP